MRMNSIVKLISVLSLIALSACTKPSASSTVNIQLPDFNKLAAASSAKSKASMQSVSAFSSVTYPSRVMINVQGSGIAQPIVIILSSKDPQHPLPQSIPISVPTGQGRLFQVLAITKTVPIDGIGQSLDSDGLQTFYYGDQTANVSGDTPIDLWLTSLNTTVSAEGAIAGRYLDATGDGPTGTVDYLFQPPNGKPKMIVSTTEIHGGWFEFSAFQGLPFSYVMRSGRVLFPGFDLGNIPASISTTNLVAQVPSYYKAIFSSGSEVTRVAMPPKKFAFGYFGPGSAGTSMCYDNSAGVLISKAYTNVAVGDPSLVGWSSPPTGPAAGVTSGGYGIAGGNCAGSYLDVWMKMNPAGLADSHGNLGFRAPFQVFQSVNTNSWTTLDVVPSGSSLALTWKWLPGVTGAGRVDGVGLFARVSSTPFSNNGGGDKDYQIDDMVACNRLTDPGFLALPFQLMTRVANVAGLTQTATINGISPADFAAGKVQIVACPYSNLRPGYFNSAASAQGNGTVPTGEIRVSGSQNALTGGCNGPLTLSYYSNGFPSSAWSAMNISLQSSPAGLQFYSDNACSVGNVITNVSLPAGSPSATVYTKASSASFYSMSAQGSFVSAPYIVAVGASTPAASGTISVNPVSQTVANANVAVGYCYAVDLELTNGGPLPANNAGINWTLADTNPTAASFYTDSSCVTPLASNIATFSSSEYFKRVYLKPNGTGSGTISAVASGGPTPGTGFYSAVAATITSLNLPKFYLSQATSWYAPGECFQTNLLPLASNGALVAPSASSNGSVTSSNLMFSSAGDCSSAAPSLNLSLAPTDYHGSQMFSVKVPAGATGTQTVNATLGGTTSSLNFYPQPDTLTLNSLPSTFMQNFCHPVTVSANWGGSPMTLPTVLTMNLSASGASFYNSPGCSGAPQTFTQVSTGMPSYSNLYVRTSGSTPLLNASMADATTPAASYSGSAPAAITLGVSATGTANSCSPISLSFGNNTTAGFNLQLTLATATNLLISTFYSDPVCTVAVSSPTTVSVPAGPAIFMPSLYLKYRNSAFTPGAGPQFQLLTTSGFLPTPLNNTYTQSCSASTCN